jgi:predicted nucleotidyltransferase
MGSLLTEPVASAVIVLDEMDSATLSDIARVSGRSVSTMQRAINGLMDARALERETPRGRIRFSGDAPRRALRELAEWRLGSSVVEGIVRHVRALNPAESFLPPATVRNPAIRRAWPHLIRMIVSTCDPSRVVVFGSQARGNARMDSDLDLLVVFDHVEDRRERRVQLLRLMNHQPFAKDVLVASREDVAKPPFGSALAEALREGVTVYER